MDRYRSIDRWINGLIDVSMDGSMDQWINGCINQWMGGWMDCGEFYEGDTDQSMG